MEFEKHIANKIGGDLHPDENNPTLAIPSVEDNLLSSFPADAQENLQTLKQNFNSVEQDTTPDPFISVETLEILLRSYQYWADRRTILSEAGLNEKAIEEKIQEEKDSIRMNLKDGLELGNGEYIEDLGTNQIYLCLRKYAMKLPHGKKKGDKWVLKLLRQDVFALY